MPLDASAHRVVERATKERRNAAARDRLAQVRGRELSALRRENLRLAIACTRKDAAIASLQRQLDDALFTLSHCACGAPPAAN